MYLNHP